MNTLKLTKAIVKNVVGASVSFTVANVVKNNVAADKPVQKAELFVGAIICGYLVGEQAENYTDRKIDEFATWCKETFKKTA